ncbi:dTMP kinase [Suicoccus acidiformans]|uniref:Thymidylate kinase n=1 Tax=Suicoccus acidiformans TaxID=2036206 RepID=A0A347WHM3_9LACT|nr:dTMP kinase [Suicoccus acidiformans]AXY24580.1 dTMP kinase [Suicoccus acidiformans]
MKPRGRFISLEGPDGSGKSTVIRGLQKALQERGVDVITTREPGGSPIAEQIREVILNVNNTAMDGRTEALLYAASRRQHLVETIIPTLDKGQWVLSDRFVDSSLAYQGVARQIPQEEVWTINQFAIEGQLPDLTLLLDVPAEVGLERIQKARGQRQYDRLDRESLNFHQKVRQAFLDLAAENDRIVLIDANMTYDAVIERCLEVIAERLN